MTTTAPPAPTVPASELHTAAFSGKDAPIKAVTVFCKNKAEVTRVINFSPSSNIGIHEVELTELPSQSVVDKASVRVKGSGYCTILHVSYSDEAKTVVEPELTEEGKAAAEAEEERKKQEIQRLTNEFTLLKQQSARNRRMRKFADSFAERSVVMTGAKKADGAITWGLADHPAPSVSDVEKALDWWAAKAVETDTEMHRLSLEERRVHGAIVELRGGPSGGVVRRTVGNMQKKPRGRIIVSIDVHELGPIELEVTYMVRGATWSPAYDFRVDTETDSISCTYFGRVTQSTTEDWEDVALTLSTAEPTVHRTPPVLAAKTISLKAPRLPLDPSEPEKTNSRRGSEDKSGSGQQQLQQLQQQLQQQQRQRQQLQLLHQQQQQQQQLQLQRLQQQTQQYDTPEWMDDIFDEEDSCIRSGRMPQVAVQCSAATVSGASGGASFRSPASPSAPPPPPAARPAVAQVESGGGGIGAVSFVVGKPAIINNGETKKLTVGELQLSSEVTHYVVPSKEPAAYLQAKTTNDTDYLLLASEDVSIFFGNSFASKTSLDSVSPGESFQAFLGIDPSVKVKVAPPRKTSRKRGIFSKSNEVTYAQSTSISNKKHRTVTCVVVDAMPRSTDEVIKVVLQEPAPSSVSSSEAITDEVLASGALETFGGTGVGRGGEGSNDDARSSRSSSSSNNNRSPPGSATVTSSVTGVVKNPSNHLAWVGKIAPQSELSIPFKYATEWPIEKEIEILEE